MKLVDLLAACTQAINIIVRRSRRVEKMTMVNGIFMKKRFSNWHLIVS